MKKLWEMAWHMYFSFPSWDARVRVLLHQPHQSLVKDCPRALWICPTLREKPKQRDVPIRLKFYPKMVKLKGNGWVLTASATEAISWEKRLWLLSVILAFMQCRGLVVNCCCWRWGGGGILNTASKILIKYNWRISLTAQLAWPRRA